MKHFQRLLAVCILSVTLLATPASAYEGDTTRVSVATGGEEGHNISDRPSISYKGYFVAFESLANNLVDGDRNGAQDIFVYDRTNGTTTRVSVNSSGRQGNDDSFYPVISSDGRYVTFESLANNLVNGDTNGTQDVFVHDRATGESTRVSVSSSGEQGNDRSYFPSTSFDGRYVVFTSFASNLVPGDTNGEGDIFVHDCVTGETTLISVDSTGGQGNDLSSDPSISTDGRYVAFDSLANNLVNGDTNGTWDVFVHDRTTSMTMRVSVGPRGRQGNNHSADPSISTDGRYVAFQSAASNLISGDTNGSTDIFVHDCTTHKTTRVSVDSSGGQGNSYSGQPSISFDGRYIAFMSFASNLVSGDMNGAEDIFVHDRTIKATTRVSVNSSGEQGKGDSSFPSISPDGYYIAFQSAAANLVDGDRNGFMDVFVHEIGK